MADEHRRATIGFEKDGPIVVEHLDRLTDADGRPLPTRASMRLCRCGHSSTKPFCDSTHKRIGWTDESAPGSTRDRLDVYEGSGITVRDNRRVCAHVGSCIASLPAVFRRERPWIRPDQAAVDDIADTVRRCPSGALSYEIDGRVYSAYHDEQEIIVSKDGPYLVRGGIELKGASFAEGQGSEHYTLCRCGASGNKPFCDGSHLTIAFRDDDVAPSGVDERR